MKHTENDYIKAGYRYERAASPNAAAAVAQAIRAMLEVEHITDQTEARRLIAQGIEEARK